MTYRRRNVPSCDGADDCPIEVYRTSGREIVIAQGLDLVVLEPDQVTELTLALLETVRELEEKVK